MLASIDVALSGPQDAASVEAAILDLHAQGYRSIGIGRSGTLEVAQTQHQYRIQLPDDLVLIGGHVRNGLWHAGNGCRVIGGLWERDDPAATDATMFRVGDVGDPRADVVFEGLRTRIGPDAGATVFPYDIRNGVRVRVLDCDHLSEVAERLGPEEEGGAGSGQGFCVGGGAWDVTIHGNRGSWRRCPVSVPSSSRALAREERGLRLRWCMDERIDVHRRAADVASQHHERSMRLVLRYQNSSHCDRSSMLRTRPSHRSLDSRAYVAGASDLPSPMTPWRVTAH